MIGCLPKSIEINEIEYKIRSDYRDCLNIITAFQDAELSAEEQFEVCLEVLYLNFESIPDSDIEEALRKAVLFLDCNREDEESSLEKQVYDWEQDEQIIFSAINKVARQEVRAVEYMHWWTFLGYFQEIGQGTFNTVVSIRDKKNKGKKLEDWEKDFVRENKSLVELKHKCSAEEQAIKDKLNAMYT